MSYKACVHMMAIFKRISTSDQNYQAINVISVRTKLDKSRVTITPYCSPSELRVFETVGRLMPPIS